MEVDPTTVAGLESVLNNVFTKIDEGIAELKEKLAVAERTVTEVEQRCKAEHETVFERLIARAKTTLQSMEKDITEDEALQASGGAQVHHHYEGRRHKEPSDDYL